MNPGKTALLVIALIMLTSLSAYAGLPEEAHDLLDRGKELYKRSEFEQAALTFEKALSIMRQLHDTEGSAAALYNLGMARERLGDYSSALVSLAEALDLYGSIGDLWGMADCEHEIGYIAYYEGHYDDALAHFGSMLDHFTKLGVPLGKGIAIENTGMTYLGMGNYDDALKCYQDALAIYLGIDNKKLALIALKDIAQVYGKRQEYENELSFLTRALDLATETGDRAEEASLLSDIGVTYSLLGLYERSIGFQEKALPIFRDLGDRSGEGYCLVYSGSSLNNLGRYEEGLERYTEARDVFAALDDPVGLGFSEAGMAFSHHELGHTIRSFFLYSRVMDLAERTGDRTKVAEDPLVLGMLEAGMERYRKAIPLFEKALADGETHDDLMRIGYGAGYLGYCHKALGHDEKAVDYYKKAIDVLERVRVAIAEESHRMSFSMSKIELYEDIVELLIGLGRFEEAFDYMERARSRALLDLLGTGRPDVGRIRGGDLLIQERDVYGRLSELMKSGAEAPDVCGDAGRGAGGRTRSVNAVVEEYNTLIETIRSEDPELASLITVTPLSLSEVREIMTDDVRIIEYFTAKNKTYIFSIGKTDLSVHSVPITRDELSEKVSEFRKLIQSTAGAENTSEVAESSRSLYTILLPEGTVGSGTRCLVVIPHGPLHYLPFAALSAGEQLLIERYALVIDPSASVLRYIIEKRKSPDGRAIAFGNPTTKYVPLPFAQREVSDIKAIFGKVDIYVGDRASETRAKKSFMDYSVVHLACHGTFNSEEPLSSALYLSPDAENDGALCVDELFGLDLGRSSLVVLSACETGLSHVLKGDELIGLSRGFIFSGTPSLVVTLWSVADDSTAALMTQFYNNLTEGMDKPESLRQAMLWLRSNPKYHHPFYWAPFVMIGDWQ